MFFVFIFCFDNIGWRFLHNRRSDKVDQLYYFGQYCCKYYKYFQWSRRWYCVIKVMDLSRIMFGSSNTILLCFLFSFLVLTMIAGCKYFQWSWRWYFVVKVMDLSRIAWLDRLTQFCFAFCFHFLFWQYRLEVFT